MRTRRELLKDLEIGGGVLELAAAREIRTLVAIARHGWLEAKDRMRSEREARGDPTLYKALEDQAIGVLAGLETDL